MTDFKKGAFSVAAKAASGTPIHIATGKAEPNRITSAAPKPAAAENPSV